MYISLIWDYVSPVAERNSKLWQEIKKPYYDIRRGLLKQGIEIGSDIIGPVNIFGLYNIHLCDTTLVDKKGILENTNVEIRLIVHRKSK